MRISKRSILMVAAPMTIAVLFGYVMPSGSILNTNFHEQVGPHGYVVLSVLRQGRAIIS